MQILFIDESGTIPPKNKVIDNAHFALGGIIIPEHIWHSIDKDLAHIKNCYKVEGEIKWRFFAPSRPGQTTTNLSHLNAKEKELLRSDIYQTITKYKSIRLICAVVNVQKSYQFSYITNENELYWYAYKQITERFQYYLQDLSRTVGNKINGIIVCDHRQPKDDAHLRLLHHKLLVGSRKNFSTYENLVEGVFVAPSHLSVGIQLADMVGGAVFRKYAKQDSRFFDKIHQAFRCSPEGNIEGYGIVSFPK